MAVDTPAKIAILGAGPLGLEAALYARFLGYDVEIFERSEVAANVLRWGHVRMFTPFGANSSPLGLAAIDAHDEDYHAPEVDQLLTGSEWAKHYLLPLAQTDLLSDHIHTNTEVVAVGREGLRKGDLIDHEDRGDYMFRILLCDAQGNESVKQADVVIDATGKFSNPNGAGQGGLAAIGESALRSQIEYNVPDIRGAARERYAGKHTLVVGAGASAATTIVALAQLAREFPGTRTTWLVRRPLENNAKGPLSVSENDSLPERQKLFVAANECLGSADSGITLFADGAIHSIKRDPATGKFQVDLIGENAGTFEFDGIVANVGYRSDNRLAQELHVQECPFSGAPASLAAKLKELRQADAPQTPTFGASLITTEPHFYVLGDKSYGIHCNFLYQHGLAQIRDLFAIIGDRPTLDLYAHPVYLYEPE